RQASDDAEPEPFPADRRPSRNPAGTRALAAQLVAPAAFHRRVVAAARQPARRASPNAVPQARRRPDAGRRTQPPPVRAQERAAMRPQGAAGALAAIAVGATLTYAVSFTISGISIHTVGVIIMLAGVAALAILLVRALSELRR